MLTSKKSDKKIVSVLTSPNICNYLSLYALHFGTAKTKIGEHLLLNWYRSKSKILPDTLLVQKIKSQIEINWKAEKSKGVIFETFIGTFQEYLTVKGLTDEQIKVILDIKP